MTEEVININRRTAIIVGVSYIIGTVAGILSVVFTQPVANAKDYLATVTANENQVIKRKDSIHRHWSATLSLVIRILEMEP